MFNRRERQAVLCLAAALCLGSAAALVDYWRPQTLEEFSVLRAAVEVEVGEIVPEWVDLNRATAAQLQYLSGIGPKMATRIIDYRRAKGPFASVEDLVQVRGIGAVTLKKIRPLLRVQ